MFKLPYAPLFPRCNKCANPPTLHHVSPCFTVGGHEWVLLFYPDGKRSISETQQVRADTRPLLDST
jgi:hypothetical protein